MLRPEGRSSRLFCVCGSGGDASDFSDLAFALPDGHGVYAFSASSVTSRKEFVTVQQLASTYVAEICKLQPHRPFVLCGYSFGGIVVYEMARRLVSDGKPVGLVALIDTLHPGFTRNLSATELNQYRASYTRNRLAKYARNLATGRIDKLLQDLRDLARGQVRKFVTTASQPTFDRLMALLPEGQYVSELLQIRAWHKYEPGGYAGRLMLLNAAARTPEYADPTLGWGKCVTGSIESHILPGDHISIMHAPRVAMVAERIKEHLGGGEDLGGGESGRV